MENQQATADYDSPWKEALDVYFESFMAFCFPDFYRAIAWEKGYETLDKELPEVVRDAETGRRLADKLVRVWLVNGDRALVLVHIEVQSQFQSDFAERMYIYNHRLFDRYRQKVFSLAVLGDDRPDWRPREYGYSGFGFETRLQFPSVKLLDYEQDWDSLEQNPNPFAVIIMAHLKTMATRSNLRVRLQWKLNIVRGLYQRGYAKNQILELLRFLDWMMALPDELKQEFKAEINRYEEENRMPYITSWERDGILQGNLETSREAVIEVLETRFSQVPSELRDRLNNIQDIARLKQLHKLAITIGSIEEFQGQISPMGN